MEKKKKRFFEQGLNKHQREQRQQQQWQQASILSLLRYIIFIILCQYLISRVAVVPDSIRIFMEKKEFINSRERERESYENLSNVNKNFIYDRRVIKKEF